MKKHSANKDIVLTAGGTGGHIYPAEALSIELQKRGYNVQFYTDSRGLGNYKGHLTELENKAILSGSVMGKSPLTKVISLCKVALGTLQAAFYMIKHRPLAVVGFGGYASFPSAIAAVILRIPLIIHEQNSVMSRTNRILARFASITAQSFSKVKNTPAGTKDFLSGMPIRESITNLYQQKTSFNHDGKFTLLVLGGSQGAKILGEVIPKAIAKLPKELQSRIIVYQQCRKGDEAGIQDIYATTQCQTTIAPFFTNMPELYQKTDLMISRSGASSVYEIAAVGVPSILVPLPSAADNHQYYNAKELSDHDAAILIEQKDFTSEVLQKKLTELINNPNLLQQLSTNAYKCAIIDAPQRLADKIEQLNS